MNFLAMLSDTRLARSKVATSLVIAILMSIGRADASDTGAETFLLTNGMQVCVIPDHRVPVVTHMVWYRVGAADDPLQRSGLAHFLEHLMFKGTRTIELGAFTRIVTGLGGRHNALTTHDTTSYFQRVAKRHLKRLMGLEADRSVVCCTDTRGPRGGGSRSAGSADARLRTDVDGAEADAGKGEQAKQSRHEKVGRSTIGDVGKIGLGKEVGEPLGERGELAVALFEKRSI